MLSLQHFTKVTINIWKQLQEVIIKTTNIEGIISMKCENYTDSVIYQMQQTTLYCQEKGEQYFKAINAGVTLDQFSALDVLSHNSGICQMDLAKIILKDRVYASRIVGVLEEKRLIERRIETKGKRLIKGLYLTSEGEQIHSELKQELEEKFNSVFKEISDEEMEIITKGVLKLKQCLSKFTIMPL